MTRVFLIRHGEPAEDARGRCYGSLDVALSPLGERQAAELAAAFASVRLAAAYASPRRRALETARRIRGDAVALAALAELDFGELEGRTYDEIARERPELYRQWMEAPTTVRFPGGESYADLRTRVGAALGELRQRHADEALAVVAHGGVLRVALAEALALPDEAIFRLDQGYARVNVVDWVDGTPIVRLVNAPAAAVGTVSP